MSEIVSPPVEAPAAPAPPVLMPPDPQRGAALIRDCAKTLPLGPGVYRFIGALDEVLYVGKARSLARRVASYANLGNLEIRKRRMVAETLRIETTGTHTEPQALLLEANLIKQHRPRYNILLRDDKSYPYLALYQDHPFPLLSKHRNAKTRPGRYFGPFASAVSVSRTITALHKAFLLRSCSDSVFSGRSRPCLQYHIKRCSAPCTGLIQPEAYAALTDQALQVLSGRSPAVQEQLKAEMQAASERLEFEVAARLRDRLKALAIIQSSQDIHAEGVQDLDLLALHREGGLVCIEVMVYRGGLSLGSRPHFPDHVAEEETDGAILSAFIAQYYSDKPAPAEIALSCPAEEQTLLASALTVMAGHKVEILVPRRGVRRRILDQALLNARQAAERQRVEKASQTRMLEAVGQLFALPAPPRRIEVYDNSHLQGTQAYGAMIVAGPEGLEKRSYRQFSIRDPEATRDDFKMLREVFTRRFGRALKEDPDRSQGHWPDLVVIDGGQGQLTSALQVLEALGIRDLPLVAIAKGLEREAGRERFFLPGRDPFVLPPNDPVLFYLQRLRDEAHRFAIGTHRQGRQRQISANPLDEITGIGPKRKKALLLHFGSAKAIKKAGLRDLEAVEGISKAVAKKVYDHFHETGG